MLSDRLNYRELLELPCGFEHLKMERVYRGPILILLGVSFFMLPINHKTDALPHRLSRTSTGSFKDFRDTQSNAMIFPDEVDDIIAMMQQRVPVSPVCKGRSTRSTYCEEVTHYPEHTVNEALKRNESLKYLAVVDEVSVIVQRFTAEDNDVPLCRSTEQVVYVQAAINMDNEWKYIANQANFKQGIRIETCSNENAECSTVNGPGAGYKTSCRQKFSYRQLVAVQPDDTLILDTFKFPSSCCCHLQFTGGLLPRFRKV
ncbi:uncharacterized protein LOC143208908 [Lasioglossum baleicum]|uniref:uncharacterized protein LOC143208908 n=1 Tax=Lasioglossum baleicum TaxID=434251 RepID=UPI003FCC64F7